jgi:hypothetical protein
MYMFKIVGMGKMIEIVVFIVLVFGCPYCK